MAVSDWTLEQLHANALPAPQAESLRTRLAGDATLRSRLAALASDDAATLAALPKAQVAAEIERRRHLAAVRATEAGSGPRDTGRSWRLWLPAVALASLGALFVARGLDDPHTQSSSATTAQSVGTDVGTAIEAMAERAKGDNTASSAAALALFRQAEGKAERLEDGALAKAGDVLTVSIRLQHGAHCAIVSIDGRGAVTRHAPERGDAPVLVDADRPYLPEHAYELDDAPGFERFFLLCSDDVFSVDAVVRDATALAARPEAAAHEALPAQPGMRVHTHLLRKPAQAPEGP